MAKKNPFPKGTTEAAMWDYENATNQYVDGGFDEFSWLENFSPEQLNYIPQQSDTALAGIQADQRLNDLELRALAELEEQSREGLTARDRADLAKIEMNANRANAGRQGAIRQDMESRGLGGSGLDFAMRQQAAQDAMEMEALAALEKAGMVADGKRDATMRMGSMAGQMGERDFARQARVAEARDVINRFNTGNEMNRRIANNQMRNEANQFNLEGRQGIANNNVAGRNNFAADSLAARQGLSQLQYNAAVEEKNRRELAKREREKKRKGQAGALLGTAGAVVGGIYGGPEGAAVGYQAGNSLGQMA